MKKVLQLILCISLVIYTYGQDCRFWPVFDPATRTASLPFGNSVTYTHSNSSRIRGLDPYSVMNPTSYFTPDPGIATTSPPNSTPHNLSDLGSFDIFPVVTGETGTIQFNTPTTTGFFLHVYQIASRLDFDHPFTLISQDGDLTVGSSMGLSNNVLDAYHVRPFTSPDDANATIYFAAGIDTITFSLSTQNINGDGFRLAFTFPDNCATPLPLSFIFLTARKVDDAVQLEWKTAFEENLAYFDVERSQDGRIFTKIGQLPSRITRYAETVYNYLDKQQPQETHSYYRIKSVRNDGKFAYSKTVSLKVDFGESILAVSPNPVNDVIKVQTSVRGMLNVSIVDISGRVLKQLTVNNPANIHLNINDLSPGNYWLTIKGANTTQSTIFFKK